MADNIVPLQAWKHQVQQGERGPKKSLTNLMIYLRNVPGLGRTFCFNELSGEVEWNGRAVTDEDYVDVRLMIEAAGYQPDKSDIPPAVARLAQDRTYHPVRDYLDALKWDGKPRLNHWLRDMLGAPNHPLMEVFGAKFMTGAVARVYDPGCQMDNMIVLEGAQGLGKTTAVGALFGRDYMTSGVSDFGSKEAAIAIQGRWVVEIAELAALNRSDIRDAKKFISETIDRYRPVHGRNTISRPRRCVFVGTTNEHQYLKDGTGNRRYWPVPCTRIDVDGIKAARDQLWAEAVARFRGNELWWITDQSELDLAQAAQADRVEEDVWASPIDQWLAAPNQSCTSFVLTSEILLEALHVPVDKQNKALEMRVAEHLSKRGWARKKQRIPGVPKPRWGYLRPPVQP